MDATILNVFHANVERFGNKPCLRYKDGCEWRVLSWKEVAGRINSYAAGLSSLGVKKGDKIGILSSTRMEWALADMATLSIGAVVVPIYPSVATPQITHILKEAEVNLLFIEDEKLLAKIDSIRDEINSLNYIVLFENGSSVERKYLTLHELARLGPVLIDDRQPAAYDIATIIYTSGTTGMPKGAMLTHANIMSEVGALQKIFRFESDDIILSFLPLAHVLGRAVQYFQLAEGCQTAFAGSFESLPQDFKEVRPHMTVVVPRFIEKIYDKINSNIGNNTFRRRFFNWGLGIGEEFNRVARRREKISVLLRLKFILARILIFSKIRMALGGRIRFLISGGAPLSEALSKFFYAAGLLILEGYGLTETLAAVTVNRPDDFHFGTVGKPLAGVEIKLLEDGEIMVRGGMVFKGYLKQDARGVLTEDGWFKTGDIGCFSRDGFLRITDRKKDIIVTSGGKNVSPQMIEALLLESPYISRVVVLGNNRRFISALIILNPAEVKREDRDEIVKIIASVIEEKNRRLSHFESIKKFAILEHDFTVEGGELTPTMKVKRRVIEEKYKTVIEGMYK